MYHRKRKCTSQPSDVISSFKKKKKKKFPFACCKLENWGTFPTLFLVITFGNWRSWRNKLISYIMILVYVLQGVPFKLNVNAFFVITTTTLEHPSRCPWKLLFLMPPIVAEIISMFDLNETLYISRYRYCYFILIFGLLSNFYFLFRYKIDSFMGILWEYLNTMNLFLSCYLGNF